MSRPCIFLVLAVCAVSVRAVEPAVKTTPNRADEPIAKSLALDKTAVFLDAIAVNWTRERNCGSCHTNYPYLLVRSTLKNETSALTEVRTFFENRIANWDRGQEGDKPRWDTEVVATAATLAMHDARTSGKLHPLTRRALDRMWTLQKAHGAWNWIKCGWPPMEHDDYFGAVYAALGVAMAPEGYANTAKAKVGLEKLRGFFAKNPPPDLHHKALLLWASMHLDGLMTTTERDAAVKALYAAQRPDGGWSLPSMGTWKRRDETPNDPNAPSDGYGTGLAIVVLRQAGQPAVDARIKRGVEWLRTNQRESGRWFTRSLNDDKAHYITDIGTCYAVLALEACDALKP